MLFRLKIVNGNTATYTSWYTETAPNVAQVMQQARIDNPNAAISIERKIGVPTGPPPTTPYNLSGDPNPTLGADLQLAAHSMVGQLEKQSLIIDGGLI